MKLSVFFLHPIIATSNPPSSPSRPPLIINFDLNGCKEETITTSARGSSRLQTDLDGAMWSLAGEMKKKTHPK